jgi:hypothetical protein
VKISLMLSLGRVFGFGFDLEYTRDDACFELQLGPINVFAWTGAGTTVLLFDRQLFHR